MLNKLIKAVSYFVVHLIVAVELYLLALLITSPVFNLVIGVMDLLNKVPVHLLGKYLVLWALVSVAVWLVLFIYEEIRTYDLRTDFKRKHK